MTEVMDCFDFNQLQPNQSQDQCGFASVALCFAAGEPGHGPRQPIQWAIQMMASWYTEYNGTDIPSNTRGMSLDQLYKLITEKGGHYQAIEANAASIASWIQAKYPVIIAVIEGSVFDVHVNASPYTWNTSGLSHIFTVTGIDHDHIFLCRDTVNQRTGSPYSYDGDKLSYLSATVFVPDWMPRPTSGVAPQGEEIVRIDITTPGVATYFEELNAHQWRRKDNTGKIIQYAILDAYKGYGNSFLCGLSYLGLPLSNEVTIESGIVKQYFERGVLAYDPAHKIDNPPGVGAVYAMHLYSGPGVDPAIASLEAKIAELQQAQQTAQNPLATQALAVVQHIKPLVQPF